MSTSRSQGIDPDETEGLMRFILKQEEMRHHYWETTELCLGRCKCGVSSEIGQGIKQLVTFLGLLLDAVVTSNN